MNTNVAHESTTEQLELDRVRAAIVETLMAIDDIRLQQNPRILAEWQVRIGCWENKLLEAETAARRARRKLALMQAAANRQEEFDEEACEQQLDEELHEWTVRLEGAVAAYEAALIQRASMVPLAPSQSRNLRKLHRILVKRLHPDLHPGHGDHELMLFHMMQAAYEKGDLALLESLEVSTRGMSEEDERKDMTELELAAELEVAQTQLAMLEVELSSLKESYPYQLKVILDNPARVAKRVEALEEAIDEWNEARADYEKRMAQIERNDDAA